MSGLDFNNKFDEIDEYDFELPDGRTVDVKFTSHDNGSLILGPKVQQDKDKLADLYVLAKGGEHLVCLVGYIEGEEIYNNYKVHPRIKKRLRFVEQEELKPITDLV